MPRDLVLNRSRFVDTIFRYPCPQRLLVVVDGLNFDPANGAGLTEFVDIVRNAGHTVHTAHRSGGGPNLTIPGNFRFDTAATAVTTANYDQIWMFGVSATPILATEQAVIAQFMQAGGGVFATGDHSMLGFGMGAHIPRVRRMREWSAIPMTDPNRLDTVLDPGADNVKQFQDQADAIPQRIFPVFFSNGGPQNQPSTWSVHPVLRHSSGAVDVLPDHAHESECLAPTPVAGNFAGVEEWPAPIGGGPRIAPVVAAVSVSAGRFIADALKPPVLPRCFGAISAYDGDPAHVGRIVCDATWHHFVNINLNGVGAGNDPSTGLPRQGMKPGGVPTADYLKIRTYFLNTVRWLAPRNRRFCWPVLVAAVARFDVEALELQLPRPHPCPWDPLITIGRTMEEVVAKVFGPGAVADAVDDMLSTLGEGSGLALVLDSRVAVRGEKDDGVDTLLPLADLRRAVFGSLVNLLADKLPEDEARLEAIMKDHDGFAAAVVADALQAAEQSIAEYLSRALGQANERFGLLGKRPVVQVAADNIKALGIKRRPTPAKPSKPGSTTRGKSRR